MRLTLALGTAALAGALAVPLFAFDAGERSAIREEIRSYLLENPAILREMIALLEAEEAGAQAEASRALLAENAEAVFDDGFSHVSGNPEGDVTVVEFLDYRCGFCRRAHPEIQTLLEVDGGVRLVTKEFPVLGPESELASRAAIATLIAEGPAAYERLGDALMTLQGPITDVSLDATLRATGLDPATIRSGMAADEVTRRIRETRGLAQALGIQGTPTFVVGDHLVPGYIPLADLRALVEAAREES